MTKEHMTLKFVFEIASDWTAARFHLEEKKDNAMFHELMNRASGKLEMAAVLELDVHYIREHAKRSYDERALAAGWA